MDGMHYDDVVNYMLQRAGLSTLRGLESLASESAETFQEGKTQFLSCLARASVTYSADTFLGLLKDSAEKVVVPKASHFVDVWRPKGEFRTLDIAALEGRVQTPPHVAVLAQVSAIRAPFAACEKLGKLVQQAENHISSLMKQTKRDERIGTKVFIGHGRSRIWKDLKDFIKDRLRLPWDEFNRTPIAGISTTARLSQMLDDAAIAFLVLTAEDEQKDGKVQARANVIHEAGPFQGRLRFERAIVLLEEGCEEFSNINGLGQIRFSTGDISSKFEEIRRVLEREGMIEETP